MPPAGCWSEDGELLLMRRFGDPELRRRGRLIRSLGAWREMLPGSFVEVRRQCGKANCWCTDGVHLHRAFQLSVTINGQPRAIYIPTAWAADVRAQVEMAKRVHETVAAIAEINLRRLLRRKQEVKRKAP